MPRCHGDGSARSARRIRDTESCARRRLESRYCPYTSSTAVFGRMLTYAFLKIKHLPRHQPQQNQCRQPQTSSASPYYATAISLPAICAAEEIRRITARLSILLSCHTSQKWRYGDQPPRNAAAAVGFQLASICGGTSLEIGKACFFFSRHSVRIIRLRRKPLPFDILRTSLLALVAL